MKISSPRILTYIGILCVMTFALGGSVALLDRKPAYSEDNPHHCKENDDREICESMRERTTEDPVAFFTLWLVVVTAGLVGGTLLQLRFLIRADETARTAAQAAERAAKATEASVERMDSTAERQLRAYVFMKEAKFETHESDMGGWYIQATIKNSGQTPAYKVTARVDVDIAAPKPDDFKMEFSADAVAFPSAALAPDHTFNLRVFCNDLGIGMAGWRAVSATGKHAYLVGHIGYEDAFGNLRETKFQTVCYFGNVLQFAFCAEGNDAT